MKLKLKTIASNVSDVTKPEDRTHALTFASVEVASVGVGLYGQNTLVITVTAEEAAQYVIGASYNVALTPDG